MDDEDLTNHGDLVRSNERGMTKQSSKLARRGLELVQAQEPRTVQFPETAWLGWLYVNDPMQGVDDYWMYEHDWEKLGPACGTVAVLPGKDLKLRLDRETSNEDLLGLSALSPADLQVLDFDQSTRSTGAGLVHLRSLTGLQELDLGSIRLIDAELAHLCGLVGLRDISLRHTEVTDAGLVHVGGLTGLRHLALTETQVTDAGLVHLRSMAGLEMLVLDETHVTDAGLIHLRELTNLSYLGLEKTSVTSAGIEMLRRALPDCYIIDDRGDGKPDGYWQTEDGSR